MEYLAFGGWFMAGFFLFSYLKAQGKLDDYRTDSVILGTLRRRYASVDKDAKEVERMLGEGIDHD